MTATGINLSLQEGSTFTGLVATFVDANPNSRLADFSASVDWGDGSVTPATIAFRPGGGYNVAASHTYRAGSFPVAVSGSGP